MNKVKPRYYEGSKELAKHVSYYEVSLYRGSFPHNLLFLWRGISFVIPRTSLHRTAIYTYFSQCLTKQHSKLFSTCPAVLSKHTIRIYISVHYRNHI